MSKKNGSNPHLLDKALSHVETLYRENEQAFMQALEGSDRRQIALHFTVNLDLSEQVPVVETVLKFKDKDVRGTLEVTETFTARTPRAEAEDPSQPRIPGIDPEEEEPKPTKKSKRKVGKEAAAGVESD